MIQSEFGKVINSLRDNRN